MNTETIILVVGIISSLIVGFIGGFFAGAYWKTIKEEQQLNKYEEIKEIVNRQLIAGKNDYKETYDCFWEIAKIVVN